MNPMNHKVLCVIRVSTEKQEITDQKNEMLEYCIGQGYKEENIIFLEGIGASAIKLDDQYRYLLEKIKDYVENCLVDAVAVWHINRLGRNDDVLIRLKNLFIEHKCQFICKNPTLKLLNDDLTVNSGAELAYSLFATMCKQDMEEKKAKFKRAKKGNMERGKYAGGFISYGYDVDKNGYIVELKEDADIIRIIFELYGSGKYSLTSLAAELKRRGICYSGRHCAKPFERRFFHKEYLHTILTNRSYIGEKTRNMKYPQIVARELFESCEQIRKQNSVERDRSRKHYFGAKIVRCPGCGNYLSANMVRYECWRHDKMHKDFEADDVCASDVGIRIDVLDGLLWSIAAKQHLDYLISTSKQKLEEYQSQLKMVAEKIEAIEKALASATSKKKKIIDTYLEDYIDKEERDRRLSVMDAENAEQMNLLAHLKKEYRGGVERLVNMSDDEILEIERINAVLWKGDAVSEEDEIKMHGIVHKHIREVSLKRFDISGKYRRGPNPSKPNALRITVKTIFNGKLVFCHLPYVRSAQNMFIQNDGKWEPYNFARILR